ncbi:hypothetical protein SDRG_04329 [Saprolegnia diclina VS20]|uniref:Uncharacterized protein n=1 Tax=Saprolegnia diclina (strain VS20) TaxID=1156394 RepID=T0S0Z8_SAPDV|nr:hypothetical protein SDRG_04329 [Saprolegnia diclina VS20]EQC38628.1 hypothetical protein SDRG_04329 [Saprolegnia diclina VS20]|eukprot:XP_008608220.1 hypothetical protein SDRG_04329 [Saprolegnia diclina VS20]
MIAPSALIAFATAASAYVQFDNQFALHLEARSAADSPWSAAYLTASSDLVTMDVDGVGGLSLLDANADVSPSWPSCNQSPLASTTPCSINVLFAISQCLDKSTALVFKQWMDKLVASEDKFLTGGKPCDITFSTVVLSDCASTPVTGKDAKIYLPRDGASAFLSNNAALTNVLATKDLIELFTPFGDVYCSLNATSHLAPNAVVSLFGDAMSHKVITAYEQDRRIHTVFNYHVCSGKDASACAACHTAFADDSVLLLTDADLFSHSPFKAVQSFHCASALPNGLPVISLSKDDERRCHCKCPTGYEDVVRSGQRTCTPKPKEVCACYWSNRRYHYDITTAATTATASTCAISSLYPGTIPRIPYPRSNYVAETHRNAGDKDDGKSVEAGAPSIQVTVAKRTAMAPTPSTVFTAPYAWAYFEQHRDAITNSLVLDTPGVYSITMTAKSYRSDADCQVCLSVVDRFRPVSTARCPVPLCDSGKCVGEPVAAYSAANVAAVDSVLKQHAAYSASQNVLNDGCSEARCDENRFYRKDMFASEFVEANVNLGNTCFKDKLPAVVTTQLQASPFGEKSCRLQDASPVVQGQCTRCCKWTTQLKELYREYTCGNTSTPIAQCAGSDAGCKTTQCLAATGETFFAANAVVQAAYKKATTDLITRLYPKRGYESTSEVHLLLECTAYGVTNEGKCAHVVAIDDLFAVTSHLSDANGLLASTEMATKYVYWRYRVNGGAWRGYKDASDASPLRFDVQKSTVVLEAWSQCGLVQKVQFDVYLHLNRKVCVADAFESMWYQSSSTFDGTGALCNVLESDFAELTFDYAPSMGLRCSNESIALPYVSSGVLCTVQYATRSSALLVSSDAYNASILKRFAFQMLTEPTTKADTTFTIACNFAYEGFQTPNISVAVSKTFTVKNCDVPGWDCPFGACSDTCVAGNKGAYATKKPAPFQVCRGTAVSATASATVVASLNQTCCSACGKAQCQSILDAPSDDQDLFRCVVTEPAMLSESAKLLEESQDIVTGGPTVLALSCMLLGMGLVLVVVVGRRPSPSVDAEAADIYYPLLDH